MRRMVWLAPVVVATILFGGYNLIREPFETWIQTQRKQAVRDHVVGLRLADQQGTEYRLAQFSGQWLVVFFGYTNCPDICPMSLSYASREYRALGPEAKQVSVIFVSVDPERDRPNVGSFVTHFHKDFVGLTADDDTLKDLTDSWNTGFVKTDSTSKLGYLMSHSADFFIINPQGDLVERVHAPHDPGKLSKILLKNFAGARS